MQPWIESVRTKYILKLTTTGRKTGLKRVTAIWFGVLDGNLYVSSGRGERSDWVKNIKKDARVEVTIAGVSKQGIATLVRDPNVRQHLLELYWRKYHVLMAFAEFGKILMRISRSASIPLLIELK